MEATHNKNYTALLEIIATQQKGQMGKPEFAVGEQLKDISRNEPVSCELLLRDLAVKEMNLAAAAAKIKEHADKHRTGNFSYVSPADADAILRKFYGLPERGSEEASEGSGEIDLNAFL